MGNYASSVSPEAFNQGAVRVNSDALTNLIVNTQAKRQAQEQAFGKYIQDQNNNINDQGVRSADLPDILAAKNDWNDFMVRNKQAIQHMNDGGAASVAAMQKYNKIKDIIARSKEATKSHQEFQNAIQNKQISDRIDLQAAAADLDKAKLPVEHGYQPFDITKHISDAPWSTQDQRQYTHELNTNVPTPKETPIGEGRDLGNGFLRVPYSREVSGDQKKQIGALGVEKYNTDPHYRSMINTEMNQPNMADAYEPLNKIYKEVYGKDIENERDMAAAHALQSHSSGTTYEKDIRKPAVSHALSLEDRMKLQTHASQLTEGRQTRARAAKGTTGKAADESTPIHDEFTNLVNDASKPGGTLVTRENADGSIVKGYELRLTPEQKAAYRSRNADGKVSEPTSVIVTEDKKHVIPIFKTSKESPTGRIGVAKDISKPIPIDDAEAQYGAHKYTKAQVLKETKIKFSFSQFI